MKTFGLCVHYSSLQKAALIKPWWMLPAAHPAGWRGCNIIPTRTGLIPLEFRESRIRCVSSWSIFHGRSLPLRPLTLTQESLCALARLKNDHLKDTLMMKWKEELGLGGHLKWFSKKWAYLLVISLLYGQSNDNKQTGQSDSKVPVTFTRKEKKEIILNVFVKMCSFVSLLAKQRNANRWSQPRPETKRRLIRVLTWVETLCSNIQRGMKSLKLKL